MRIVAASRVLACGVILALVVSQLGMTVMAQEYLDPYDLLIITHEDFVSECERLAVWKNSTGMPTAIVTWQDLVSSYTGGDLAERIKRGIEYWYSTRRVKYVLLMGDADVFPVRYIAVDWGAHTPEPAKIHASDFVFSASDLYYADLFNASEDFDDWDWDKNGMYGELWGANALTGVGPINHDKIDMYPDVAVGRVPASTVAQVANYVDKVISYETHAKSQTADWMRDVLIVGEGVDDLGHYDWSEELGDNLTAAGFTVTEFYDVDPANRPRPSRFRPSETAINNELAYGKGLLNLAGHGHPLGAPSYGHYITDDSVWVAVSLGGQFNTSERWQISLWRGINGMPAAGNYDGDDDCDVLFFQSNGTVRTAVNFLGFTYIRNDFRVDLSPHFKPEPGYPRVGDFNGDGKDDVVQCNRTSGEVYVSLSQGFTFDPVQVWSLGFCTGPKSWVVGDFNGDLMFDVAYRDNTTVYVAPSTGTGFSAKQPWLTGVPTGADIIVGDYSGDGLDDLAFVDIFSGDVTVATSAGQWLEFNTSYTYSALCPGDISYGAEVFSGDCWGDGTDDLLVLLEDSRIGGTRTDAADTYYQHADVLVLPTDGTGFTPVEVWKDHFCVEGQIPLVADFNNDTADDLMLLKRVEGMDPFDTLNNKDKYPIVFASSCSTAQFAIVPPWFEYHTIGGTNQTGTNDGTVFADSMYYGVNLKLPPPPHTLQPFDSRCMAERFLVEYGDCGGIAYFGGVEVVQGGIFALNGYFVEKYATGENILGNIWNYALERFLTTRGYGHGEQIKIAAGWGDVASYHHPSKVSMFGDPSLRVFDAPDPTTPTYTTPPPIHIVVIGGAVAAAIGIAVIVRRVRFAPSAGP